MIKKLTKLLWGLPLVATIAGPMAYFKFFDRGKAAAATSSDGQSNLARPAAYLAAGTSNISPLGGASPSGGAAIPAGSAAAGVRVQDAASVFNFNITPEWIVARWPNVSTGLADLQWEGYRVALVTGTAPQDLAGSLTYYFDARQKLRQITFIGVSGDPRAAVGLLANRFQMTRRLTNDPGLIVYEGVRSDNRLASSVHIRLAPPAEPGEGYRRYNIEFSLQRPEE